MSRNILKQLAPNTIIDIYTKEGGTKTVQFVKLNRTRFIYTDANQLESAPIDAFINVVYTPSPYNPQPNTQNGTRLVDTLQPGEWVIAHIKDATHIYQVHHVDPTRTRITCVNPCTQKHVSLPASIIVDKAENMIQPITQQKG